MSPCLVNKCKLIVNETFSMQVDRSNEERKNDEERQKRQREDQMERQKREYEQRQLPSMRRMGPQPSYLPGMP